MIILNNKEPCEIMNKKMMVRYTCMRDFLFILTHFTSYSLKIFKDRYVTSGVYDLSLSSTFVSSSITFNVRSLITFWEVRNAPWNLKIHVIFKGYMFLTPKEL